MGTSHNKEAAAEWTQHTIHEFIIGAKCRDVSDTVAALTVLAAFAVVAVRVAAGHEAAIKALNTAHEIVANSAPEGEGVDHA